jgi:hypothetical protein
MSVVTKAGDRVIATRIPLDLFQVLRAHGTAIDRTDSWVLREALTRYLDVEAVPSPPRGRKSRREATSCACRWTRRG